MVFQKIIPMIQYHSFDADCFGWNFCFVIFFFFFLFPVITFRRSTEFPIRVTYVLCLSWNRNSPHATINALQVEQYVVQMYTGLCVG